jgi:hypothetical protein
MIKWHLKDKEKAKRLKLIEQLRTNDPKTVIVNFVWDGKGYAQTDADCRMNLDQFIAFFGSELGLSSEDLQWKTCSKPHWRIWEAANNLWGYPRA